MIVVAGVLRLRHVLQVMQHMTQRLEGGAPGSVAINFVRDGQRRVERGAGIVVAEMIDAGVGPDVVMLDNFGLDDLRTAVLRTAGRVTLEASGGVNLQTVRAIAETGVNVISVGALTHSAATLDIGLDAV